MVQEYVVIAELIYKNKIGIITERERQQLDELLAKNADRGDVSGLLSFKDGLSDEYDEYMKIGRGQAWSRLKQRIVFPRRVRVMKRFGYAASVLILLGLSVCLYQLSKEEEKRETLSVGILVAGGSQKAVLHRSGGEKVILDTTDMVIVDDHLSNKIEKVGNALVYETDTMGGVERWDVLEVPNGCEFQLKLADGTKVWLNAQSRLSYPVAFVGKMRVVRLEGEAYFEVQRDEMHPFVVEADRMKVKVLGTSFNLKSFPDEGHSITTLISGKVEVYAAGRQVILFPDQQACLNFQDGKLEVKNVDSESYRAWMKGQFACRRESLESIMNDLARWYDVTVIYDQEGCKDILFSGIMDRYKDISETLSMIEKTGKVRFDIQGSCIVVKNE